MEFAKEFTVRDVRCFEGHQRGTLRPITLLVGENSTGKTTFLSCYSAVHRLFADWKNVSPNFNFEPFSMGSFRDIVRRRGGRVGRINEFSLGLGIELKTQASLLNYECVTTFAEELSQPTIESFHLKSDRGHSLKICRHESGSVIQAMGDEMLVDFPVELAPTLFSMMPHFLQLKSTRSHQSSDRSQAIISHLRNFLAGQGSIQAVGKLRELDLLQNPFPQLPQLVPVAPLRSKPQRTYDPLRETFSPEGAHVPMVLRRLAQADKARWDLVHGVLQDFGRESGLFTDIKVQQLGRQIDGPFRLQVKASSGPFVSLMDVGYGVSQSLPVLVEIAAQMYPSQSKRQRQDTKRLFVLQQPEVHLHPRGQAALASLLVKAFNNNGTWFLVETHSDNIIDRVRISVKDGLLRPEEVSILYFEPRGKSVRINNIILDEHANLINVPVGYRDFFLNEGDRLLGFAN